ncbi:MAG: phosphate ABC transporter substrate-binding protein PstS [Vulcanimicrobiaceae bacterium]
MRPLRIIFALLVFSITTTAATFAAAELLETGSSLVYPLMNLWVPVYTKAHPDVKITTQSTGSGTGISQAVAGIAQIGASDAYMSDSQLGTTHMLNIPLAISAQQINYNLPGLNDIHLNMSGPVLAGIYDGSIHFWDDAKIKAINGSVASKLPHRAIIPIHRADGSGDTFIFTQYLTFSAPSWKSGPGYGTTISWPAVSNAVGANGNPGMVQACQGAKFSIAYIGVSFLDQTNSAGLGYAALENKSGKFVLPTEPNLASAANALVKQTPKDERISIIFGPGASSYPIINYEYAIVNPRQKDAATASEVKNFLTWTLTSGQAKSYLQKVHFIALPASIVNLSKRQIAEIGS